MSAADRGEGRTPSGMSGMSGTSGANAVAPSRSYLFVPGDRPERFAKALASGADRIVLDLEDAVAPDAKAAASAAVATHLAACSADDRARCVVRINDAATPWFNRDIAMLAAAAQAATGGMAVEVMLPKTESPADIAAVRAACPGSALLPLLESARGVLNAEALAAAPGVQRLVFGTIDFALDLGLSGDAAGLAIGLDHAAARIALSSRAAGIAPPVAGVTPELRDDDRFRADLARARAHGFGAKLCIHPQQVAVLHAALQPGADEVAWAQRVVAATRGSGAAVQVDGRMVDRPVLQRAHAVLARASRN